MIHGEDYYRNVDMDKILPFEPVTYTRWVYVKYRTYITR